MFPVVLTCCLILALPLMRLRYKFKLQERNNLIAFTSFGFTIGLLIPVIWFGKYISGTNLEDFTVLWVYGLLGSACSISAWNYLRVHAPYNKSLKARKARSDN